MVVGGFLEKRHLISWCTKTETVEKTMQCFNLYILAREDKSLKYGLLISSLCVDLLIDLILLDPMERSYARGVLLVLDLMELVNSFIVQT